MVNLDFNQGNTFRNFFLFACFFTWRGLGSRGTNSRPNDYSGLCVFVFLILSLWCCSSSGTMDCWRLSGSEEMVSLGDHRLRNLLKGILKPLNVPS